MKKMFLILAMIIVMMIGGVIVLFRVKSPVIGKFCVTEYQTCIDSFALDRNLGKIDNAELAKEKAELVWIELFGEIIKEEKPYRVFYDEHEKVWLVESSYKKGVFCSKKGGVSHIIIKKANGRVLAVWRDK